MVDRARVGWTQALCEPCFAAWEVGAGRIPREPVRLKQEPDDVCLICGTLTVIYVRIDPAIASTFEHAMLRDAVESMP